MEGCGRGSVTFNLTPTPNGLDTISFKTRLAQFHDLDDMAYCFADGASSMTNYTFVAQACFDEDEEFKNFSGEGSVSLFAGYRPSRGAYEYRVSVYDVDTAGAACCRHAIYKWKVEGGRLVAVPLIELRGDEIGWTYSSGSRKQRVQKLALGKNSSQYSGMFISFAYNKLLNTVTIIGGVTMSDSQSNKEALSGTFNYNGKYFYQISVEDKDPVTTKGTYGVLARNCPARIYYPRLYKDGAVPIPVGTTDLLVTTYKGGKYWKGVVPLLTTTGVTEYKNLFDDKDDPDWSLPPGGMESFDFVDGAYRRWGLQAASDVTQNVNVAVLPLDSGSGWTNLTNIVVQTFNFAPQAFSLQTTSPCHVRLSAGGTADDARMDIAVDDIYLTQWCGVSGTSASPATSSYGYWKDFYYMGAWISNRTEKINGKVTTERVAVLAPRRADSPNRPVGIRTPYLEGYGALMFDYKDCGEDAEIEVQRLDISADNLYGHLEDAADDSQWVTVTNFTFTAGERGTKTLVLGMRLPAKGVLRVVIPQSKVRTAYEHPECDPNWAAVTITDIYCYDKPEMTNPVIATDGGATVFRTDSCEVTITCATDGTVIYYTDDGTTPKKNEEYLYTGPITITETTTFKAIAVIGDVQSEYVTVTIEKNPLTLEEALDIGEGVVVETGEGVPWIPLPDSTAKVGDATARSGAIGNRTNTWLSATVEGAGVLSFWCKVSCEHDEDNTFTWDRLMVYTNDVEIVEWRMDGETDWTERTLSFDGGANTVKWVYYKDRTGAEGEDCAWVDAVAWTPREPIPSVAADATPEEVTNAIVAARFADAAVRTVVGGKVEEYNAFKAWAGSVKGTGGDALAGETAVVANAHAAAAYLLGAERLFENEPTVEFGEVAVEERSSGTLAPTMTVAVTVKDGETAVAVNAEKVAAMFEATGDLGDWTGAAKLMPTVTTSGTDASGKMTFVVTPGDGTASKAFLRIRR